MAGTEPTDHERYQHKLPHSRRHAIKARVPGPGTGDTLIVTTDGHEWLEVNHLSPPNTGDRRGRHDGTFVYEI